MDGYLTTYQSNNFGPHLIVCLFLVVFSGVLQSIICVLMIKKGCSRHAAASPSMVMSSYACISASLDSTHRASLLTQALREGS